MSASHPDLRVERRGDIVVIRFDNPPVNALNNGIRAALDRAIDQALADHEVSGILFAGAGDAFVAGADIGELQAGVQPPFLGDMLRRIERSPKRSGAAIRGHAVGGGLEIALACDIRVATADARFALPEIRLALIPGAGGTQRLPRRIGTAAALDLMLSGRMIDAPEAVALGLIDAIAGQDVERECLALMTADLPPNGAIDRIDPIALEAAAQRIADDPRLAALPAAHALIEAVTAAQIPEPDNGFARERALFLSCLQSPEAVERLRRFIEKRSAAARPAN